jgi:tetratricopeptide (TPR) repeat protein
MYDKLTRRRNVRLIANITAVVFGAVAWIVLGPLWAIPCAMAGLLLALIVLGAVVGIAFPGATTLVNQHEPYQALKQLRQDIHTARRVARIWPGWREVLATDLILQSSALHQLHQDAHALLSADEAVTIYQALAVRNPGKYAPDLADALDRQSRLLATAGRQAEAITAIETAVRLYRNLAAGEPSKYLPALAEALTCIAGWLTDIHHDSEALAAAHEATSIYWHRLPQPELPPEAARAALLEGQLLSKQGRHHEAATMLARGWHLAVSQHHQDALSSATPAVKAAYHADPDDFAAIWNSETGAPPPDWLKPNPRG